MENQDTATPNPIVEQMPQEQSPKCQNCQVPNSSMSTTEDNKCSVCGRDLNVLEVEPITNGQIEEAKQGQVLPVSEEQKHVANRDANGKFLPGTTGNPHGRPPRDWTWAGLIEKYADKEQETKRGKFRWRELVIKRLFSEAANGNMRAITEIIDRMDGKPVQESVITADKDYQISVRRS